MCTLIVAQDVLGPQTVLLAANRDEDPARPSAPPTVLEESPRVVGGKDLLAGGTWLAMREGRVAVALLNRRSGGGTHETPSPRSRGLLCLETAAVPQDFTLDLDPVGQNPEVLERLREVAGTDLGLAGMSAALQQLWEYPYAPFSLVWLAPEGSWVLSFDAAGDRRFNAVGRGWHVMAHQDLDDRGERRVAWLLDTLGSWRPEGPDQAVLRLGALLRSHGEESPEGTPPVCLHGGRAETVSSAIVFLSATDKRYLHAQGPPCERPYDDYGALLR